MMTDMGGEVQFQMVDPPSLYKALVRNHITSMEQPGFDTMRAIKFIGSKKNTCAYFKEDYTPAIIFRNWKAIDYMGAKAGPSVWTFTVNPTAYALCFK